MRLVATMLVFAFLVTGCGARSEAFMETNELDLVGIACGDLKVLTEVEERALVTDVESNQKRKILMEGLARVCSAKLMQRYLEAWDNHDLAITLQIRHFRDAQLLKRLPDQAWIKVTVVGNVVDESGTSPVKLRYKLLIIKTGSNWLLEDIVLEQ